MCHSDISQSLSVVGEPASFDMVTTQQWKNMASVRTRSGSSTAVMCAKEEHFNDGLCRLEGDVAEDGHQRLH